MLMVNSKAYRVVANKEANSLSLVFLTSGPNSNVTSCKKGTKQFVKTPGRAILLLYGVVILIFDAFLWCMNNENPPVFDFFALLTRGSHCNRFVHRYMALTFNYMALNRLSTPLQVEMTVKFLVLRMGKKYVGNHGIIWRYDDDFDDKMKAFSLLKISNLIKKLHCHCLVFSAIFSRFVRGAAMFTSRAWWTGEVWAIVRS